MTALEAMSKVNRRSTCYYAVARTYQSNPANLAQPKMTEAPLLFVYANPLIWAAEEMAAGRTTIIIYFAEIDYLVLNLLKSMGLPCLAIGGRAAVKPQS